jgi:hypothetical protein
MGENGPKLAQKMETPTADSKSRTVDRNNARAVRVSRVILDGYSDLPKTLGILGHGKDY